MSILIVLNFFLVGTAFASSLYVPSVPQHCSETHGCSLCRNHEQNRYHGNNEYFFGESSSMAGSNWWQYQARGCNWSTCLYPFLFLQKVQQLFYLRITKIKLIYSSKFVPKRKLPFYILFWRIFYYSINTLKIYLHFIVKIFTQSLHNCYFRKSFQ